MDIKQEIPFEIPIDKIIIGRQLAASLEKSLQNYASCLFVCDENTKDFINLVGERMVLPNNVKPSLAVANSIPNGFDIYVAIGSGTINDIVKFASHRMGKPYIVFATAASMNGYASANCSLLDGNYKKSFYAACPREIFMDLDVIEKAPKRLTSAGIADSYCRQLCENDNILANAVRGDEYFHALFRLIEKYEDLMFDDIEALCKTLIFGGVAMFVARSSVPASGAEHMIAHYMELMQPTAPHSLHGHQIAVCSIAIAKLQADIIRNKKFNFKQLDEGLIRTQFANTNQADYFLKESRAKFSSLNSIHIDHAVFELQEPEIMEEKFKTLGLPTTPNAIGWKPEIFEQALQFASFTRNRITFLDFAI